MKCPVCKDVTLALSERNGVEIDYCPECRGIWLDRGELDKVLDKANNYKEEAPQYYKESNQREQYYKKDNYHKDNSYPHGKKKKKESFVSEIFDIFGD